jgi:hypothetical protein
VACTLTDTAERLDLLRPALADVAAAARAEKITLSEGDGLAVDIELAPVDP